MQGQGSSPASPWGEVPREVLLRNTCDMLQLCACILVSCSKSRPASDSQSPRPSAPERSPGASVADDACSTSARPDLVTPSGNGSVFQHAQEKQALFAGYRDVSLDRTVVASSGHSHAPCDTQEWHNHDGVEDQAKIAEAQHLRREHAARRTLAVEVLTAYSLRCVLSHTASVLARAVRSWDQASSATSGGQPETGMQTAPELGQELEQLNSLFQMYALHWCLLLGVCILVCVMSRWLYRGLEMQYTESNAQCALDWCHASHAVLGLCQGMRETAPRMRACMVQLLNPVN